MDNDDKFYLWLMGIAGATIVLAVGVLCLSYYMTCRAAFEAGYEERSLPGRVTTGWVHKDSKP